MNTAEKIAGSSPATPLVIEEKSATPFCCQKDAVARVVSALAASQKMQNLTPFLPGLTTDQILESDRVHERVGETYRNQNRAGKILYGFERLILAHDPAAAHLTELEQHFTAMNKHSTIKCLRVRTRDTDNVGIRVDQKHRRAIYTGVHRCGSPWACQPCANKIQARRAKEIQKLYQWAYADERKQIIMITRTFPHGLDDDLGETMEKYRLAEKYFHSGKVYTNYKNKYGYEGMVKASEITYGRHGWHPHPHELHVLDFNISAAEEKKIRAFILHKWELACKKAGLIKHGQLADFRKHAVDVIFHTKDSDYLSKIDQAKDHDAPPKRKSGADKEMASASTKKGRASGKTPFQLLEESDNNTRYKELFLEYALHFKGRRQLVWSRGLKALVGIVEKSDEQLASEQSEKTDLLALLSDHQWRIVNGKNNRRVDERAHVEWIAVNLGFDGLADYFAEHNSILAPPDVVDERVFEMAMTRIE